jgi:hypothetical protein
MSRSGRYWKRFFDIAAPSFVAVYVYLMISASHNSRRGLVLSTHDWKRNSSYAQLSQLLFP